MTEDLADLRRELDGLDRGLVDLVARRLEVVSRIGRAKTDSDHPVRDLPRERAVLDRVEALARERGVSPELVHRVFREIIGHAVDRQTGALLVLPEEPVGVAVVGRDRAAALAARKYLSGLGVQGVLSLQRSPRAAIEAVQSGRAALAVLPVESSTSGTIGLVHELLERSTLSVVGEELWRGEHGLVADRPLDAQQVRTVLLTEADEQACTGFLATLSGAERRTVATPALALEGLDGAAGQVALVPLDAVEEDGLVVLRTRLADQQEVTRLLVLAREPVRVPPRVPCKTSLHLVTGHAEGALLRCLSVLSAAGVTMTRLESRPVAGRPFEYAFFVDVEGNIADAGTRRAVEELRDVARSVRVLGSYPAKLLHGDAATMG